MQIKILHKVSILAESQKGSAKIAFQVRGEGQFEDWISRKQLVNLMESFGGNDYSNKRRTVYAIFEEKKFVWSGYNSGKHNGAKWLVDKFSPTNCTHIEEGLYIHIPELLEEPDVNIIEDLID